MTNGVVEIPLSGQYVALVDAEDADLAGLHWRLLPRSRKVGTSYVVRAIPYPEKNELLHRVILERMAGQPIPAGKYADHINGDGLDNRRCNLRLVTQAQNLAHSRMHMEYGGRPKSSRFRGVCWAKDKRKWLANITKNGKTIHIGHFDEEETAARAWNEVARMLHGEFAVLNEF